MSTTEAICVLIGMPAAIGLLAMATAALSITAITAYAAYTIITGNSQPA